MSLPVRRLHSFFDVGTSRNFEGIGRPCTSRVVRRALAPALVLLAGCTAQSAAEVDNHPIACSPVAAPSANALRFAVFGDVRPAQPNDTAHYPTAIATALFQQIAARAPSFVVGTGDYMFVSSSNNQGVLDQLGALKSAEQAYAGPIYHALGNHECTGATASNCPLGGETANMRGFMDMLVPAGTSTPYYRVDGATPRGAAKVVLVAANAWSDAQAAWLEAQLAEPTAYTFVVRHEAPSVSETAGAAASEAIIAKHPLTLELLGHWHRYEKLDDKHVVSGNAGAPLSGGSYGFVLVDLSTNGNLAVSEIDQATGDATDTFTICPQ